MSVAEYEKDGRRYWGVAECGGHDVRVGSGRKPGMAGTLAATSDGWTDTGVLRIPIRPSADEQMLDDIWREEMSDAAEEYMENIDYLTYEATH